MRISVDGRRIRNNKVPFSNLSGRKRGQGLRPPPLIFMFLTDMVRQSRVSRSAKKKGKKRGKKLARTFKDTKLKRIKCRFIKSLYSNTVLVVCERVCKVKALNL